MGCGRALWLLLDLRIRNPMSRPRHGLTRRLSVGFVLVFGAVSFAQAWGSEGHQVIALIAQAQLTPKAKAEVDRLLANEPGESLASISNWAHEHRNPATAPWHYINFPRGDCVYKVIPPKNQRCEK